LPPFSPAGSACLSSKGIVNSICRARESDSQQQSDWTNGPASSQSFSHLIWQSFFSSSSLRLCRLSFLSSCVDTIPPISTPTHTQTDTHTLFCSFVLAVFFLLLALSHLFLQHLNRIRLDGGSQTGRKSPGGRLIRRPLSLLES
jgi:hypothetical protein